MEPAMPPFHLRRPILAALALSAMALLPPTRSAMSAAEPAVSTLAVPQRANAHVSLAAGGVFVAATWAAALPSGATDIYCAVSTDSGRTFGTPVRVNATPGDARVNGEQPPRLALTFAGEGPVGVIVVWTTKGTAGTVLRSARSTDGGKTFGRDALVPGTDAPGNRGWEAIAAGPLNRVFAAWLDHRKLAPAQMTKMEGEHHHGASASAPPLPTDSVAQAQLSQLYVGPIDGSSTPVAVTGGVCYCCKTAVVGGNGGELFVAWRHVYARNMRDIAFAVSRDRGRTFSAPIRVSEDQWQIDGCPDDGPTMAVDPAGRVHIVWPTVINEKAGPRKVLFHAVSADKKTFSSRVRIPTEGQANHPQMVIRRDGTLRLVWDESGSGSRRIAFARGRLNAAGTAVFERSTDLVNAIGTYPVVAGVRAGASVPDGVVAAWTSSDADRSVIRVAHLR
jgi:hypothetical protein